MEALEAQGKIRVLLHTRMDTADKLEKMMDVLDQWKKAKKRGSRNSDQHRMERETGHDRAATS